MVLHDENWTVTCKRIKVDYCKKINSKWIKDLNIRHKTINILQENIGSMLFDINLSWFFFLDLSPQAGETKAKRNRLDYITLKIFCTVKKTKKAKRPRTE